MEASLKRKAQNHIQGIKMDLVCIQESFPFEYSGQDVFCISNLFLGFFLIATQFLELSKTQVFILKYIQ